MKKARFISVLLAAVIASAPATGLTSKVLPGISNTITASAASNSKTVETTTFIPNTVLVYDKTILINGSYSLVADKYGNFYIKTSYGRINFKQKNNNGSVTTFTRPYDKNSVDPRSGDKIMYSDGTMYYSIYLQGDGNLVAYSKNDTKKPLWHTNSYSGSATRHDISLSRLPGYKVLNYKYELTSSGKLLIKAHYYLNGRISDITIWDSSRDYIYRVV